MTAQLCVLACSPGSSIQDGGRHGWARFGVTVAGPMDWAALRTANAALGNPVDAAALEIASGGLSVTVDAPVSLAFAGAASRWTRGDRYGSHALPPAARILLRPGEELRVRAGAFGTFSYLAVPGGLAVPAVMNSRSTQMRSGFGGLDGRSLRPGDRIAIGAARILDDGVIAAPWLDPADALFRVVLGPQDDYFDASALEQFFATRWTLSSVADRMAYKLDGAAVPHARDFNIVSDGIALGAIQIAGDGKPMVLMADRQPTGGYPKIAHLCRVDLGRFAQLRPGAPVRFVAISRAVARDLLIDMEDRIAGQSTELPPLDAPLLPGRLLAVAGVGGPGGS